MGVHNLWNILESVEKTVPIQKLNDKSICIDLSFWLCQFSSIGTENSIQKPYIRGIFHRLRFFLGLNCKVVVVADGNIPGIKLPCYYSRIGNVQANSSSGKSKARSRGSSFSRMVQEIVTMAEALGIPVLFSPEEAEAQCAALNASSLCDICCTGDSDSFLFGSKLVMKDIDLGKGRSTCTLYDMADIESVIGLERSQLIALGILLGSDYGMKVKGCGIKKSLEFVKSSSSEAISNILKLGNSGILSEIKKGNKNHKSGSLTEKTNLQGEEHDLEWRNSVERYVKAFTEPNVLPADSAIVKKAMGNDLEPNLESLKLIMNELLGWEGDVTERYIVPKLAEREIRKAALNISHGVPLKESCYQVTSILKKAKHFGESYYVVEWHGTKGQSIEPSELPCDLVLKVCPNLVDVFLSKKKERKNKGMVRVTSKIEELVDPALNYQNVAEKTSEVHSWMDLDYLLSTLSISKENVSSQDPPKVQRNNIPVVIEILSSSDDE